MSYILRIDLERLIPGALGILEKHIYEVYPNWGKTQAFLREIRAQSGFHKKHFSHSDVEDILEQVADNYGRWQDKECHELKTKLLALEDNTIGTNGSGRVRMTEFYGSALNGGNWQFTETREYLKLLGILDSHDPNIPRLIIPNYINSPSNCLAGSRYYSICCMNECEDLIDSLEHRFKAPAVLPSDIIEVVSGLASSTVSSGRTLPPILVARLHEIAKRHGGVVPMQGRLFAQWMHHAYPRECPYPHLAGTTRAQRTRSYRTETNRNATHMQDTLKQELQTLLAGQASAEPIGNDECAEWSSDEEMYVTGSWTAAASWSPWLLLRPLVYFLTVAAMAVMLAGTISRGNKHVFCYSQAKDFLV